MRRCILFYFFVVVVVSVKVSDSTIFFGCYSVIVTYVCMMYFCNTAYCERRKGFV